MLGVVVVATGGAEVGAGGIIGSPPPEKTRPNATSPIATIMSSTAETRSRLEAALGSGVGTLGVGAETSDFSKSRAESSPAWAERRMPSIVRGKPSIDSDGGGPPGARPVNAVSSADDNERTSPIASVRAGLPKEPNFAGCETE